MLAGCTNIVQKDYSNATDHAIAINSPVKPTTATTAASPKENQNSSAPRTPPNVDAAIFGVKVAAGFTTVLFGTSLALFAYTDDLPYVKRSLIVSTGLVFIACSGYIYSLFYNSKASDKQTQHFVQAMKEKQDVQPRENEECPICLEPGNSNQPLYPLPDCPCPSHYLHIDCIITYIQATPLRLLNCPVCRVKMDMNVDINKSLTKRHVAA
ncbi:MAG: hypothetical protein NMK33_02945 [Candidatus Cardinium sp.]|uniref:RING finger protein n=1 Tax=Cardinium endosymbiont of Dermatophagoides farinae TaxID=2597823 RepID=UPI0011844B27|nr:RING-H2 finger protein [Cardinium endosymbiont of Dermatophagoides farinae]TSJ81426.1 hypothetical protein FPG78_05630 [Cardinium endosymbiont of Dermatophagoides farinae]UWW97488.1 MAG: hypothetical protein NMK33_02945 [Candidatus Cardinium sp.]